MQRVSIIDAIKYNLRCFNIEKQGGNFVVSNVEFFLENCSENFWKKNLPTALMRLAECQLEKNIIFILPESVCLNLVVLTQEDPRLTEKQKIEKALHKEFGLCTDKTIFRYMLLYDGYYAVTLVSCKFLKFFKPLIQETLNFKDKNVYYFPPFIGHLAYAQKKFSSENFSQIVLFVEKYLRRFIIKTEEGLRFLDFKTSSRESSSLWKEILGTQKFIQNTLSITSGIKHWILIGENFKEKIESMENTSYKIEETISELSGVKNCLDVSEQSLLVGILTSFFNNDTFKVFDFSKVDLPYSSYQQFFKILKRFGLPILLLYVFCMALVVRKETSNLICLQNHYKKLNYLKKQVSILKMEIKQYEEQAFARTYLATAFINYLQIFYELPFQVCLDCVQTLHQKKQVFLEIKGHILTENVKSLQTMIKRKVENLVDIKQRDGFLFDILKESSNFTFFKIQIPLSRFPKLLSGLL